MRFLIVGCQRSGTTMLAALLARHPALVVHDEGTSYRLLSASPPPDGVFKVPRWGDLLPGPTFGDPDQALERPFEWTGEPMVHIVRDPLDVAASMDHLQMAPDSNGRWRSLPTTGIDCGEWEVPIVMKLWRDHTWSLCPSAP